MEIIFLPKDISSEDMMNEDMDKIISESKGLLSFKKDFNFIDNSFEVKTVNIGTNADYILLWSIFTGLGALFFLGDKIEKNIEAWSKIGKRIKKVIRKSTVTYIDKDFAIFLCVDYLYNKYKTSNIELKHDARFSLEDLSNMIHDRDNKDFIASPHSIYYFSFEINNSEVEIISVRSDGKIKCLEKYNYWENTF